MSDAGAVLIYDDTVPVPAETGAVAGVTRFGDLLRRRRRLGATVRELALAAGFDDAVHLASATGRTALADGLRGAGHTERLHLVLPAHLAPTAECDDAVLFLRKLRQLTEPVALWHGSRAVGACLLDRGGLLAYLVEGDGAADAASAYLDQVAGTLPGVGDGLGLVDLRELTALLEFLSGGFSARHFNHVAHDRHEVVKRSADPVKMRREHDFWTLLPRALQPYVLQPFDLREDAAGASYRMRRVFVPDLAVQWVHGALTGPQVDQALDHLFHVLEIRPEREVGAARAAEVAEELYVTKVRSRVAELLATEVGAGVDATLRAGGIDDGVAGLVARYERLWERVGRGRRSATRLAVTHGDLCFSNILYSPATQSLQLIDPRGAATVEELYSDPLYDVAKLSHSMLGSYDFVVAGLYELVHGDDLRLSLALDPAPDPALQARFLPALERAGFRYELVRTCEASLFLSMLPLHRENPKRVVALAVRARDILDELEARRRD